MICMGLCFGWLLGYVLLNSPRPSVKASIAGIGALFCGTAVLLLTLQGAHGLTTSPKKAIWLYPPSLLIGLIVVRIPGVRNATGVFADPSSPENRGHDYFTWLDLAFSAVIVLCSIACTWLAAAEAAFLGG